MVLSSDKVPNEKSSTRIPLNWMKLGTCYDKISHLLRKTVSKWLKIGRKLSVLMMFSANIAKLDKTGDALIEKLYAD